MSDELVKKYYDYTGRFYRRFWHGETNAIHYGVFDTEHTDFFTALINTNRKTAKALDLRPTDIVADFGSGVGGSAFWIAREIGAKVYGITLSEHQFATAMKLRGMYHLESKTEFKTGNYFNTGYDPETFDAVYGIEALCYGQCRITELASEMYRVLKPGGRVASTDGYVGKESLSKEETKKLRIFEKGFVMGEMITVEAFMVALQEAGFVEVLFQDLTENILPTALQMYTMTKRWYLLTLVLTKLGIVPQLMLDNNITGQVQLDLFQRQVLRYGIITAKKPK
jgi:tocopherol O-methyltransferase